MIWRGETHHVKNCKSSAPLHASGREKGREACFGEGDLLVAGTGLSDAIRSTASTKHAMWVARTLQWLLGGWCHARVSGSGWWWRSTLGRGGMSVLLLLLLGVVLLLLVLVRLGWHHGTWILLLLLGLLLLLVVLIVLAVGR